MADLLTRAQIELLADARRGRTALSSLERLGAEGVHALRSAISDALFDSLASRFALVSKLAPIIPNAVVIAVAQKALPPEVSGRAGGAVGLAHEDRAVAVLSGMKPTYLADAARYVDPRVIPHFVPKLPARLLIPTAKELLRRRDYLTASRFVEYATEQHIVDFEKAIDDDEGLVGRARWSRVPTCSTTSCGSPGPIGWSGWPRRHGTGHQSWSSRCCRSSTVSSPNSHHPRSTSFSATPTPTPYQGFSTSPPATVPSANCWIWPRSSATRVFPPRRRAGAPQRVVAKKVGAAADTAARRGSWKRLKHAISAATEPAKALD